MKKKNLAIFLSSARTALKLGLKDLNLDPTKLVLVPDFICDVVIDSIINSGLNLKFYPTGTDFNPLWDDLEIIVSGKYFSAVVMVHYFGQPQDVARFKGLCDRFNLILIEDNAHGYSGCLNGVQLGTFGDIGISSPRKILRLPSGGTLYGASKNVIRVAEELPIFPFYQPEYLAKIISRLVPSVRRWVRSKNNVNLNWNNPRLHRGDQHHDSLIDRLSHKIIAGADWEMIAVQRRSNWNKWVEFGKYNGWKPVFNFVHHESCPWAMPFYVDSIFERNKWLKMGSKKKIELFPWPTLPDEIISNSVAAIDRWSKLLCVSLDSGPCKSDQMCKF